LPSQTRQRSIEYCGKSKNLFTFEGVTNYLSRNIGWYIQLHSIECNILIFTPVFGRIDDLCLILLLIKITGYTKMLVGVGVDNSIEIVDLNTPETTCQHLPDFPQFPYFAVGGLINYGIPIICGSQYVNIENIGTFRNKCLKLENGAWTLSHNLTDRFSTGIIESPFQNKPKGLYILGAREYGSQRGTSTDHLLTYDGVEDVLPTFPLIIHDHCFVLINSTTVMVIGGRDSTDQDYQDQVSSSSPFYEQLLSAQI